MSTFAVVFLCIQACLVQNVFSQCLGAYGPGIAPASLYSTAPCGYGAGLAELTYPGVSYAGAYPATGYGAGLAEIAYPGIGYAGACPGVATYGGAGEGNVAVAGELPAGGNSAVVGQVPIMGAVNFNGAVPAAGAVSINGNCACGCGSPYLY